MDWGEVIAIMHKAPMPPGESLPPGASDDSISKCEQRLGVTFPQSLRSWLRTCNGPCVGPGGITGIKKSRKSQDIEAILGNHPNWLRKGWIPVAGDGCGNYYTIAGTGEFGCGEPVLFLDCMENESVPAFVVASNLQRFLTFLLRRELDQIAWPYDRTTVEHEDPEILSVRNIPLPWSA